MKGKKIIIAIIVMLIILLMAGGAFAYIYVATDILKSDKEMFFKYFAEITAEDGFVDKRIDTYGEMKKQNPYENSGTITAKVQYPEEGMEKIIEKVNELVITYTGKVDSLNEKVQQDINVDYGNDVVFPISYRQDGNSYGLQSSELARKYIAVRNEDLKKLLTNLGVEDVSKVPDTIEFSEITNGIEFSDEEKETLKQIYGTVLEQNLLDENFSSIKTEQSVSYTLELSNDQIKNIFIKMLEATKENTLIIDKINKFMLEQDPEAEKIDASAIDDIIADIKGEETSNNLSNIIDASEDILEGINEDDVSDVAELPNLKLILIQTNKELTQITIQSGETLISIEKSQATDSLSYNVECEIKEEEEESADSNSIVEESPLKPTMQYNIYFKAQYKGLDTLNNVEENYEFGFRAGEDEETMKYDYEINTNTAFTPSVSIEPLDDTTAVFLNDADETQVTSFLAQLGTRLADINKNKMTELGLKEYENPLLYTNPVTMLGIMVYNMASETIENVNFSQQEQLAFNDKFTQYEGEMVRGSEVNALIKTVQNSNLSSASSEPHFVKVTLDGAEVSGNVDSAKTYKIEAVYDVEGYISEMKVTTNN